MSGPYFENGAMHEPALRTLVWVQSNIMPALAVAVVLGTILIILIIWLGRKEVKA